jgi:hypothetical protein
MLWNRPPDKTPIPHFARSDDRNLDAARARNAELHELEKGREKAGALVSPRPRQAHIWDKDRQGFYVEPRWCSERLFAAESFEGPVHDPACGLGRIVESARKAGRAAYGTDLVYRSPACERVADFFTGIFCPANIVCNPPFSTPERPDMAQRFVTRALEVATRKVAMLVPLPWVGGEARSRWLATTPLARVWVLVPRPSMPPGALIEAGMVPGGGRGDFCWLVWERGFAGKPEMGWLRRGAE